MMFTHSARNRFSEFLRRLLGAPAPLVQAAALPWRKSNNGFEVLLVTSRGTGRWILPKGWPETGETLWQSAARESFEEAGLHGDISQTESGCYYYCKMLNTGFERRCEVRVFPIEVAQIDERWPEKGQRRRKWLSPHKAAKLVAEPDLSELILEFSGNPRDSDT